MRSIRAFFLGLVLIQIVLFFSAAVVWAEEAPGNTLPDVSVAVAPTDVAAKEGAEAAPAAAVIIPAEEPKADEEDASAPQAEPELEFRSLEEQKAQRPLSEANVILNSTMEVIDFREEDLQDVLRLIAAKSRLNIIMQPEGVKGKVTLHLENVKLGVALENILKSNGLAYVVSSEENIVRIVDAASVGLKKVETKTEVIQLNWVDAVKLAKTMADLYASEAKIIPNQETNALIVTSTPPNLETIRGLVAKADIPERQVLIEARLVDLTVDAQRLLGVSTSLWRGDGDGAGTNLAGNKFIKGISPETRNSTFVSEDEDGKIIPAGRETIPVDALSNLFPVATGGQGLNWAFGEVVNIFGQDFNLSARIQALEDRNLVEILANPRVVTLNNILAKISIIQKIPYTESVIGVSGATTLKVEFADAGIDINVTPIITANGFVRMNLTTSQKIFRGRVGQGDLDPPLIDNRDANTNVIVQGSDTVMIGGLRELRAAESSAQVPWFGKIPMIGWLFKNKRNDESKTELVLFVTPTIIEQQPTLTTEEKGWYDRIDMKWHLPDYFFDDVKTIEDK